MKSIYFIGIGGIGMSAIALHFLKQGAKVAGYDRTPSEITANLERCGATVHFEDSVESIGEDFRDPASTLVVYTPAIPKDHSELNWFGDNGFEVVKRSEILGHLSQGKYVMAVAGTHGKTTTSTLVAWLNHVAGDGGSAFLGGISKNFGSNLVSGEGNRFAVEADEFDRSFLRLFPDIAIVTSADADHLDIYGTHEELKKTFTQFISQIQPGGALIIKRGVELEIENSEIAVLTYSCDCGGDFYASNLSLCEDGCYKFDLVCPGEVIEGCKLGVMGRVNVENAVAAAAAVWIAGCDNELLKEALASYKGVKRRFECYINTPQCIYIDDYAHHPEELRAAITSIRSSFPGRHLKAIFQPHLYTRTRDFAEEFAVSLSLADEVILLPIYPAREEPIEGVNSEMIAKDITAPHRIVAKSAIAHEIEAESGDIIVSFGAGDIDAECAAIAEELTKKML